MPIVFVSEGFVEGMCKMIKIEACARAAHEVNRAYCLALGDTSQVAWEEAPEWQRSSAINGVKGALDGNTPEESHESWLKEKKEAGWKYGPIKDAEKKEHPCFVPYAELPPEQRAKDFLFVDVVRAVASALGMKTVFEVGDVVRLKSGGPDMTVSSENPRAPLWCIWFVEGVKYEECFSRATLVPVRARS